MAGVGQWELLRPLGQGGMGVVYLARHRRSGVHGAIKMVKIADVGLISTIRREIRALAKLDHPGVVRVLERGIDDDGLPWYAMELIQGLPFDEWRQELSSSWRKVDIDGLRDTGGHELAGASTGAALPPSPHRTWWTATVGAALHANMVEGAATVAGAVRDPIEVAATIAGSEARHDLEDAPTVAEIADATAQHLTDAHLDFSPTELEPDDDAPVVHSALALDALPPTEGLSHYAQLASTLAWLHGEGLVHRDLKPQNVLVRPDRRVILVDFGLAALAAGGEREHVGAHQETAGTVAYMAPEQLGGSWVDARADLYAFGVMLYEHITGRLPYEADSLGQLVMKQLSGPPPTLSELVPETPADLSALVARLLSFQASDRPGFAEDAARVLLRHLPDEPDLVDFHNTWNLPRSRLRLHRPELVGRRHELDQLGELLRAAREGRPQIVLVAAPSGMGKTRLVLEFLREAGQDPRRRPRILAGTCVGARDAHGRREAGGAALGPILEALVPLEDECMVEGPERTKELFGEAAHVLSGWRPQLLQLPGMSDEPAPPPVVGTGARVRALMALDRVFGVAAAESTLIVVIDDLQWADRWTIDWLAHRARHLDREERILIIGTYRSDDVPDALGHLAQDIDTIELSGLTREATRDLMASMLSLENPPPEPWIDRIDTVAAGNPFAVAEQLRAAAAEGSLTRDTHGHWHLAARPFAATDTADINLAALVARRFAILEDAAVFAAKLCAVIGKRIDVRVFDEATRLLDKPLRIDELLREDILEEADEREVVFSHDALREFAEALADSDERQLLHSAVANALWNVPGHDVALVAEHLAHAGRRDEARDGYLRAGSERVERGEYADARRVLALALELGNDSDAAVLVQIRRKLADAHYYGGEPPAAIATMTEALALAREAGLAVETADTLIYLAGCCVGLGDWPGARAHLTEATPLMDQSTDERLRATALDVWVSVHRAGGALDDALRAGNEALALWRELDEPGKIGATYNNMAIVYFVQRDLERAQEMFLEALAGHRRAGNRPNVGITLGNIALIDVELGRPTAAFPRYREALGIQRQLGNRRAEGMLLSNIAAYHALVGELEISRELSEESLTIHDAIGNRFGAGWAHRALGVLARLRLDLDEARRQGDQARVIFAETGDKASLAALDVERARVLFLQGERANAETLANEALALATEADDAEARVAGHVLLAEMARDDGDLQRANEVLADAVAIGCERARAVIMIQTELGQIAILEGRDPQPHLDRAQAEMDQLGAGPEGEIGRMVGRLRRAAEGQPGH